MCRWGCPTVDTTYMCKWCGTRYCRACLRGDFTGVMPEPSRCRKCNQKKCQGERVEYVEPKHPVSTDKKGRGLSSKSSRSSKSAKSTKSKKSAKKKSGKKRKK
ncbi:uncharacterized protein LOC121411898 [Lytechinus variegatus]|uniref:uncharacterized protein LOC121411898 n=1 Tax=Lytechinus variegatus TaxID=7654 RepID=UPI001BB2970D|nr:uncharacterized protein LOC121411898 [Lytechinus variegatus]